MHLSLLEAANVLRDAANMSSRAACERRHTEPRTTTLVTCANASDASTAFGPGYFGTGKPTRQWLSRVISQKSRIFRQRAPSSKFLNFETKLFLRNFNKLTLQNSVAKVRPEFDAGQELLFFPFAATSPYHINWRQVG